MNKQSSSSAGLTLLAWIRSVLAFRHQNPVARLVSTVVAFAMATLLVVGSGAAYADQTAPTAPATDTAASADPTVTDTPPADTSTAPAASSVAPPATPTDSGGTTTLSTTTSSTPGTTPPAPKKTATTSFASTVQALPLACPAANGIPHVIGGFEIDGNTCVNTNGNSDWSSFVDSDSNGVNDILHHADGAKDDTAYTRGDAENTDAAGWHTGGSSQGKDDITDAYSFTQIVSGDVWTYFAVDRVSDTGTTTYDLELNHNANSASQRPDRSVGDLLLQFSVNGTGPLGFDKAYSWTEKGTGGFTDPACFESGSTGFGWCPLETVAVPNFYSAVSVDGLFAEGALNLSALASVNGHICTGVFGQLNLRTVASEQHTAALQDYVLPFDTSIPSTCGSIVIHKYAQDGTTLVGGAHFTISPDPTPGSSDAGPVTLIDGGTGDADHTADGIITINPAEAGTYTVVETQAPSGYLLPPLVDRTVTLPLASGAGETATFDFTDPKQWSALTAKKTAQGDYDSSYAWNITKSVKYGSGSYASSASQDSANLSESFDWKVSIGEGARTLSNRVVSGAITISNPNNSPVLATVAESLTGCTIYDPTDTTPPLTVLADADLAAGFQVSVPANGNGPGTAYQYACTQSNISALSNTATVSVDRSDYPRNQADVTATDSYNADVTPGVGNSLSPSFSWTEHNSDGTKVIHVNDVLQGTSTTHANSGAPWTHTWGNHADATWNATTQKYEHLYSSPVTTTAGHCATVTNTATIVGTDPLQTASASATHCAGADLVVTKDATASLTRTYPWSIRKAASTDHVDTSTTAPVQYSVTVTTASGTDSAWHMSGTIDVQNPNDWSVPATVTDTYTTNGTTPVAGATCVVNEVLTAGTKANPTYSAVSFPYTVPANTTSTFHYDCSWPVGAAKPTYTGINVGDAKWNASTAHTPTGEDTGTYQLKYSDLDASVTSGNDWVKNLVNDTITVYDDNATPGNTADDRHWDLSWADVYASTADDSTPHSVTLTGASDPSTGITFDAPAAGTCANHTNTVKVIGDNNVVLDADGNATNNSATVQVCNPATLTGSKTATPQFTRTYNWHVVKQVRTKAQYGEPAGDWQDVTATWTGDQFSHDFEYRVVVERGTPVDSAYKMSGTITVHNPNMDPSIPAVSAIVSEPATIGGVAATCSIDDGDLLTGPNAAHVTLASNTPQSPTGTDVTLPYTCDLAGKPADGTRNSATVTWGDGAGDHTTLQSPLPGVTYDTPTTEIDKSVTAIDDMGTAATNDDVTLGTVTWDQAGVGGYAFDVYSATHTATTTGCSTANRWTNTVTLFSGRTVKDSDTATAAICPTVGTWTVSKTSDVGDGPVPVGSAITYTLTAHKTGGVNPTNVVLYDDLSLIASHVSLPTQEDLAAAAPDGSTATITGSLITWTISELGADQTLDFTVHVNADAYNVDLPNLVTSPGSTNCPGDDSTTPADIAAAAAACKTDNDTPHYTLAKSSDPVNGSTVMPPYRGADGTIITYALTVHNNSAVPINPDTMSAGDRTVTDNLSYVLDNADWVGNITQDGVPVVDPAQAVRTGDTLTWVLADVPAGGTTVLTYQVQVKDNQWDQTLTNVATPGHGGDCLTPEVFAPAAEVVNPNCTTTTRTPPYALIQALKVDADTQNPLAGAEFTLSQGETVLETGTSKDQGLVTFTTKLQPGTYQVTETKAPDGYALPTTTTQDVEVTADDLDNGEVPVQVTFADPPQGALTIAKAHQERSGSSWVASDGQVNFGDEIKYVMTVTATGVKVFHDVVVTDYVPGWNPDDHTTAPAGTKGELELPTITCNGAVTCTSSYDATTGLITWHLTGTGDPTGDVQGDIGTVEFVVRMPNLPVTSPLAGPGVSFAAVLWNQAYLDWRQSDDVEESHHLASNTVTDAANATLPPQVIPPIVSPPKSRPPAVLPNTGGPDRWILVAGLLLLLGGGTLVLTDRRRKHRS